MTSSSSQSIRTPLGRARGLGSAGHGTSHWLAQRLSALALMVLTFWFVSGIAVMAGKPYESFLLWMALPQVAVTMILFVLVGFWHTVLGLQVVIEDYVHDEAAKLTLLILVRLGGAAAAIVGVFSVLKVAL